MIHSLSKAECKRWSTRKCVDAKLVKLKKYKTPGHLQKHPRNQVKATDPFSGTTDGPFSVTATDWPGIITAADLFSVTATDWPEDTDKP